MAMDGCEAKHDDSYNVDCEFVLPPFPLHMAGGAHDDIRMLLEFIERNGGRVSKSGCGLHVHVGNRMVKSMSPREYLACFKNGTYRARSLLLRRARYDRRNAACIGA